PSSSRSDFSWYLRFSIIIILLTPPPELPEAPSKRTETSRHKIDSWQANQQYHFTHSDCICELDIQPHHSPFQGALCVASQNPVLARHPIYIPHLTEYQSNGKLVRKVCQGMPSHLTVSFVSLSQPSIWISWSFLLLFALHKISWADASFLHHL